MLAPIVPNPTDDGIEAVFQVNVAGVLELAGERTDRVVPGERFWRYRSLSR